MQMENILFKIAGHAGNDVQSGHAGNDVQSGHAEDDISSGQ